MDTLQQSSSFNIYDFLHSVQTIQANYKPIRIDVGRGHCHAIWYWNDLAQTNNNMNDNHNLDIQPYH